MLPREERVRDAACHGRAPPLRAGVLAAARGRPRGRRAPRGRAHRDRRRRARARHPVDAAGRAAVEDRRRALAPARRLLGALRLSAARGRRLRRARLRDPLHQQRHRLPARELCARRRGRRAGDAAARRGGRRAARQQRRRLADGARAHRARRRRRLDRDRRAPRRRRVHEQRDRPVGRRRERSRVRGPRARHVRPRQRLASVARAVLLRPRLARALPRGAARARRAARRDRARVDRRRGEGGADLEGRRQEERREELALLAAARGARQVHGHLPHARRPRLPRPVDRPRRAPAGLAVRVPRSARRQLRALRPGAHDERARLAVDLVRALVAREARATRCRA